MEAGSKLIKAAFDHRTAAEVPKEAMEALIPNTIVELMVKKIVRGKNSRIERLEGRYLRSLALCHSGKHLYQDDHRVYQSRDSSKGLNPKELNELLHQHRCLMTLAPSIECIVDKDRYIYDKDMPHLSFEVDDVREGSVMTALVADTSSDCSKLYVTL